MALEAINYEDLTKRKRTKRPRTDDRPPMDEDEYLALCLIMLARSAPASSAPPDLKLTHKCSVCEKAFGSYQALGGHKASHHRRAEKSAESTVNTALVTNVGGRAHECSICGKAFPTGQALGGHKRCHFEGVIGGKSRSSSGVSSAQSRHDFDLNLLPAIDGVPLSSYFSRDHDEVQSPHPLMALRI